MYMSWILPLEFFRLCGGHPQRLSGESGGAGFGGGSLHVLLSRSCKFDGHISLPLPCKQCSHDPSSYCISVYILYVNIYLFKFRITFLCMRADIRIGMQLQQRGDGAVSDGGEAAAHPDEAAQGEHKHKALRTDTDTNTELHVGYTDTVILLSYRLKNSRCKWCVGCLQCI